MTERASSQTLALQLGELAATVRLQGEANGRRFAEILTAVADTKAQTHEIKHDANGLSMGMVAIGERLKGHIERDDEWQSRVLEEIRTNREVAQGAWNSAGERMKAELQSHRDAIDAKIAVITEDAAETRKKLDTLLTFRNKTLGAVALIMFILTIVGGQIAEGISKIWHSITK